MGDAADNLTVYLVGGAVRDRLLGLDVHDRDWVVVGATPAQMIARGFKPVGDDFPVFLHPHSGEQYALARRERKTAKGHKGFDIISDPTITLEQDLKRRDLTVNAIAEDSHGRLIDPFGGVRDIERRQLRHISTAFAEDPLRVLRAARFAAALDSLAFAINPATCALMKQMVDAGEVDALQPERVWRELQIALTLSATSRFVRELRDCGALAKVLPEVDALFGVPQPAQHHPEIDTGEHVLLALDAAHRIGGDERVVFAVLAHDLGKACTPRREWPAHRGHEKTGLAKVRAMCERLRAPREYLEFALRVCEFHLHHHRLLELKPATVLKLLERLDAFRKPDNVRLFLQSCAADLRGRKGMHNVDCPQGELLLRCYDAARAVDAAVIAAQNDGGENIKRAIRNERIRAIAEVKRGQSACDEDEAVHTQP